jgi:hypothetical protein
MLDFMKQHEKRLSHLQPPKSLLFDETFTIEDFRAATKAWEAEHCEGDLDDDGG